MIEVMFCTQQLILYEMNVSILIWTSMIRLNISLQVYQWRIVTPNNIRVKIVNLICKTSFFHAKKCKISSLIWKSIPNHRYLFHCGANRIFRHDKNINFSSDTWVIESPLLNLLLLLLGLKLIVLIRSIILFENMGLKFSPWLILFKSLYALLIGIIFALILSSTIKYFNEFIFIIPIITYWSHHCRIPVKSYAYSKWILHTTKVKINVDGFRILKIVSLFIYCVIHNKDKVITTFRTKIGSFNIWLFVVEFFDKYLEINKIHINEWWSIDKYSVLIINLVEDIRSMFACSCISESNILLL